ncbi:MAG TPA: sugar ABC transporter permease, partial [Delftia acidovorans]|nr:sugar ABC transporter permease [Delftia acidovorans]
MTNLQAASSPPLLGRRALDLRSLRERYGVVIALIALCAALALANPHFMTWGNWADILRQTSINGILAIGMTCVVLTAGIDLSVGAILALAGMVGAWLAADGQGLAVSA